MINGKKHTPSSGTLKKMKARSAAEAAAKKAMPKAKAAVPKAKAKMVAPIPATRSARSGSGSGSNKMAPIPAKMPQRIKEARMRPNKDAYQKDGGL
jgi:hypothetical protein